MFNKSVETCIVSRLGLIQGFSTFFFVLVLLLQNIQTSNSKQVNSTALYAQSISNIRDLEHFEIQIVKDLTHTLLATQKLPLGSDIRKLVHLYLTDFYQSSGYSKIHDFIDREENQASENPICSFSLIRRVAILLKELVAHKYFHRIFGLLYENIVHFFLLNVWPHIDDMEVMANKILKIQMVHDLDAEQLANGYIAGVQTNCTLNYIHCYEIAKVANRSYQFATEIQWLDLAKEKAFIANMTSIPFIEFSLWNAIEKHNMEFDDAIKMDLEPAFFDREISHVPNDSRSARKIRNLQQEAFKGIREFSYESINYWSLCSGEQLQTEIEKSYLFCWYEFKIHPTFEIGPVKMEFLSRNPDIIQMYEVIYENEIQKTISKCSAKMTPSTYENQDYQLVSKKMDKKAYVLYHRTSVTYFFKFSKEKEFDQKTELLTGMIVTKTNASEDLQVLSYSVGAHISPHVDEMGFTSHTNQPSTFRIATWMLYLNDVKLGGETAFVSAGVRAKPVKGSAVLWFNIFSDGTTDWASNHASCPILLGEKWGADKWVKYGAQIVNRKCSLKQGERYQYPVNNVYLPVPKIPGRN